MSPQRPVSPSRRTLLQWAAGSVALGCVQVARAQQPGPRLVVVMLRGALDGLSMVAPYGEAAYTALRPGLALAPPGSPDGLLKLDTLFGLHPACAPLMPWWQQGRLAFVHASGSHDPTRSHFDAQDYLESATPGRKSTPAGWLNRLATVLAGPGAALDSQRLTAVNLGPAMPRILTGPAPVASLAAGRAAVTPSRIDQPEVVAAFNALYAGDDRLSTTVREATASRREMLKALASDDPGADVGALSLVGLAADVARLGELMARDARVRLAFVPVGGWDTHANQGAARGALADRLALLSRALDTLAQRLGDRLQETTVLVLSEFGRTVRQNGTGGTDHGHGNVAMLLGAGVAGGRVHGEWPGLDDAALHEGRDLAVTTDFRDLIADLLERRWRLGDRALENVLPGFTRRRPGRAIA